MNLLVGMVHHAAQVFNACSVGADGLTPIRRLKGRKFGTELAGVGERVWLRERTLGKVNKFNPRCGCSGSSSPYIVMDLDCRFHLVWTVKKICFEDRRKIASPTGPISAGDLEVTPPQFTCSKGAWGEVNPSAQSLERAPVDVLALGADHEPLPRRLFVKQGVFLAHGMSWHCTGRRALLSGGRAQGHTEECRNRVEGELNKTEVDKLREVRQREFDLQEVQDATSWTVREKYKRVS